MFFLFGSCLQGFAGDVSLAWDPSPSDGVIGYKVYYGQSSGNYSNSIEVGNQTTYTVGNLTKGIFFFAITAYDAAGNESGFSNEVSFMSNGGSDNDPAIVDVDPDDKADLLFRNSVTGEIYVWLLDGITPIDGLNGGSVISSMPPEWHIIGMGDFDGDGSDDLVWRHTVTGQIYMWLMDGITGFSGLTHGSIIDCMPPEWQIAALGDFDGDGKDDLIWRHTITGQIYVWLMDGITDFSRLTHGSIINELPAEWQLIGSGNFNGQ